MRVINAERGEDKQPQKQNTDTALSIIVENDDTFELNFFNYSSYFHMRADYFFTLYNRGNPFQFKGISPTPIICALLVL